jgi:hypothetical protein
VGAKGIEIFRENCEMPPKIILDTNVCSLLSHNRYAAIRGSVIRSLSQQFQVIASATTFSELLISLVKGSPNHFETHRERLRVMAGDGSRIFLPYGITYAVEHVLGIRTAVSPLTPEEWEMAFRVAMLAQSQSALLNGTVRVPPLNKTDGYNAYYILEPQRQGKEHHVKLLEQVRALHRQKPTMAEWAKEVAENVDL